MKEIGGVMILDEKLNAAHHSKETYIGISRKDKVTKCEGQG